MSPAHSDSIFWIEVDKIRPNPFQPRREFDEEKLRDLAESIRQYGVLQPLVATRKEELHEEGGLSVIYELVVGERRLRAAKMAGLSQVPLIIRSGEDENQMKLELAIIENLQREDLNPVDRALAFQRLVNEFHYKHAAIAKKIGRSREYVSNTIRLLALPQDMLDALVEEKLTEGHARSLLMLAEKPEEQRTLFREVVLKRLTVRDTESIARRTAVDRVRKKELLDPLMIEFEQRLADALGTRVRIEQKESGGKILIDYFSQEDLQGIMARLIAEREEKRGFLERLMSGDETAAQPAPPEAEAAQDDRRKEVQPATSQEQRESQEQQGKQEQQEQPREKEKETEDDLYSVKHFSI